MTVGQRIAQKRKELGLSQEALGEQLGVSRQSIYKWESDTVLPEVEKLIALSRMFSVSVGWLLGEEDAETGEEARPRAHRYPAGHGEGDRGPISDRSEAAQRPRGACFGCPPSWRLSP